MFRVALCKRLGARAYIVAQVQGIFQEKFDNGWLMTLRGLFVRGCLVISLSSARQLASCLLQPVLLEGAHATEEISPQRIWELSFMPS